MHLWIREIDKSAWQLTNGGTAPVRYTSLCGSNLQEPPGAVWARKGNELGAEDHCHNRVPRGRHQQGTMSAAVRAATGQWGKANAGGRACRLVASPVSDTLVA